MKIKAIEFGDHTVWFYGQMGDYKPLVSYADEYLNCPIKMLYVPEDAYHDFGVIRGFIIDRTDNFQVERFVVEPNTILPVHGHPDVDSLEMLVRGDIEFHIEGKPVPLGHRTRQMIRVGPGQEHGARIGPAGGSFISIQRWLNGIQPTSVGLNWSGEPHEAEWKAKYVPTIAS